MQKTFEIQADKLSNSFTKTIQELFKNQRIRISIETIEEEMDETDYLLSSDTNKKRLLQSIQNIEAGKNLKEVSLEELKDMLK